MISYNINSSGVNMQYLHSAFLKSLFLIMFVNCVSFSAWSSQQQLNSFEEKPATLEYSPSSTVSLSNEYFKAGEHSLMWQFKQGDSLQFKDIIGYQTLAPNSKSKARHTFMTWVYNPKAITQSLHFEFSTQAKINSHFEMTLNFTGWRAIAVPFDTDMQGKPDVNMNMLTITAPNIDGRLYFDLMALSIPVDPRWPTPDFQVPFVNKTIDQRANAHWGALLQYDTWQQSFDQQAQPKSSTTELLASKKIVKRIDQDILKNTAKYNLKKVKSLLKRGRKLAYLDNGELKSVQMWRQLEVYKQAKINKEMRQNIEKSTMRFEKVGKHLLKLAIAYRKINAQSFKKSLAKQFYTLVKQMHKHGYVRGSGAGVMHHQGYSMKDWSKALFLGRDMLGDQKEAAQQAIAWLSGLGRIFKAEADNIGFNVDVMNTFLPGMLMSILMESNDNKKVAYLRSLSQWMSFSMTATKGLGGGIQNDGSFYHHAQHYVAYGNGGLSGLSPVVYYIGHTPFEITDKAYQHLKKSVLMTRVFSNGLKVPMSLSGRHPEEYVNITLSPFIYLTLMGDKDIARAYLRLMNVEPERLALLQEKMAITPEEAPRGSWVMNYSNLAIHRQDEWLATARGFSRYLVGNESYVNANHYGRYSKYGHVEILPSSTLDSGYREPGWDWNRWSGTTTEHLPFEKLQANITQVDEYSGEEEMLLADESYSGATQLNNQSAVFAMKLHGHGKYNSDLRARKSVFFFDNRIIALGSNISSTSAYPTETTLFQQGLDSADTKTYENGLTLQGLETQKIQTLTKPSYYMDTRSNAYFITENQTVKLIRQPQKSFENEHKKPTEGQFATLLIDHGKAPTESQYQYAILINTNMEQSEQFNQALQSEQPPFTVLRKDRFAHIVEDFVTKTTGYALFEQIDALANSLIHAIDTPAILMSKQQDDILHLSVTNPDLNLYQGEESDQLDEQGLQKEVSVYSRKWRYQTPIPSQVKITLHGQWTGQGANYQVLTHDNNQTIVTVNTVAGAPVQLTLFKVQ